jgi:sodium transport system permease protein
MLVPIVPVLLLSFLPYKTQLWMYAVPLMGQQVVIARLVRGDSVPGAALLACFVCTTLVAIVAGVVTARIYRSERLAISA